MRVFRASRARHTGPGASRLLIVAILVATLNGQLYGADNEPPFKTSRHVRRSPVAKIETPAATETQFRVTSAPTTTDPALQRAYAALNAGALSDAATGYTEVLQSDAHNADALHGLAVIALRQGQWASAEALYLRAITADPRDALAVAGLVGLRGSADPASESRLQDLIAEQPWQHALHFALGNVYAAAGRWSEAQRAFFNAASAAADHPDYLFNLAVAHDHLRQPILAVQYYGRAIAAADKQPALFDSRRASARLQTLQR